MGSIITLGIKKMDIDWGKNNYFNNHSILFQKNDFDVELPYYYYDDDDSEKIIYEKGASKKLRYIKDRLNIIGYDLDSCRHLYYEAIQMFEYGTEEKVSISFEDFSKIISNINVLKVNNLASALETFENGYGFLGEYFNNAIIKDAELLKKFKDHLQREVNILDGEFLEMIHPYIILRLLAENSDNLDYEVEWRYNDIIENGWVKRSNVILPISQKDKILIVTEGSTDSFIIKKTIHELYEHIEDLFDFIDMREHYPFTNTGNLTNFCMGLQKINILNYIIAIYDNDTTGIQSFNKAKSICKNDNMLIYHLPYLQELNNIKTTGPDGEFYSDINGKAVAIECFLDFNSVNFEPIIRWSNYNETMGQYQGALINKDEYTKQFKRSNLHDGSYDCSKLNALVDDIIESWIKRKKA